VQALAFDLDGTIYLGPHLLPGARALIEALHDEGVPYVFATNNSSKTAAQYLRHLGGLGIPVERSTVVTSNDVARAVLAQEGRHRPYLLATPEVTEEYAAAGFAPADAEADCVLLTFDTTLTYAKLRRERPRPPRSAVLRHPPGRRVPHAGRTHPGLRRVHRAPRRGDRPPSDDPGQARATHGRHDPRPASA
jgi:hypothetical protein